MTLTTADAGRVPAGTGTVDTGTGSVFRRANQNSPKHADYELIDGDGHVFGHVYHTDDGYAGGTWASQGPAAFSPGHHSLEAAEDPQIAAYVSAAVTVGYQVDVDHTGLGIWEPVAEGKTRAESASPIDAGVRAREIEAIYSGVGARGNTYRVTITCLPCGRQVTAYTPDPVERGVPEGARL